MDAPPLYTSNSRDMSNAWWCNIDVALRWYMPSFGSKLAIFVWKRGPEAGDPGTVHTGLFPRINSNCTEGGRGERGRVVSHELGVKRYR